MNIALIGYGKMSQQVEKIALEKGHTISAIIDPTHEKATAKSIDAESMKDVDVAIDFSHPDVVVENMHKAMHTGTNMLVGTTGWYDQLEEIKSLIEQSNTGLMWSSNFSIGVHMYFKIVEYAAKLANKFPEYDIWGTEIHHFNKVDSPSGTAKTLEHLLLRQIERKTAIVEDKLDRKIEPHEIHFSSTRGGAVNFGHTIGFDSPADTISLSHSARNRDGYALGAVLAAEWLDGKKGFYNMDDFLNN